MRRRQGRGGDLIEWYTLTLVGGKLTIMHDREFAGDSDGTDTLSHVEYLDFGSFPGALVKRFSVAELIETEVIAIKVSASKHETIRGADNFDELNGLNGNDKIFGLDGDDVLHGGRGNDSLHGGKGIDLLTGGNGADVFVFLTTEDAPRTSDGVDRIADLNTSEGDRIDLAEIDARQATGKNERFGWIGGRGSRVRKANCGIRKSPAIFSSMATSTGTVERTLRSKSRKCSI